MKEEKNQQTKVFFWGKFKDTCQTLPKQVTQLSKCCITKVSSGGFFFLAANDEGQLWGWGTTKHQRFGITGAEFIGTPTKIPLKVIVNKISAGNWHSLLTDSQGKLYGVGHNKYGALGLDHFGNVNQFTKVNIDASVTQISAGDGFSIVISAQGQMYGAGHHSFHGHKSKDNLNVFKKICAEDKFIKVHAGFTHALAINTNGDVYSWGEGQFLQLGHGNKDDIKMPRRIQALKDKKVANVSCTRGQKYAHSMAATADGQVYTWGSGYKGKLGHFEVWTHADPADEPIPKLLKDLEVPVLRVIGGGIHSGILSKNGELLTFGCGSDGRIGHIQSKDHKYLYRQGFPRKIEVLDGYYVLDVSFSYYHNICVAKIVTKA